MRSNCEPAGRSHSPVLVDTNAIIEAHRIHSWRPLAGGWRVETVEACVAETQTGFQLRRQEEAIDLAELRGSLAAVHSVNSRELAELALRKVGIALDEGEEALWAHALGRDDAWLLCGPDRASLRCGVRLGHRERLVSLEQLLKRVGHRSSALRPAYTQKWHDRVVGQIHLEELSMRNYEMGIVPGSPIDGSLG